MNGQTFLRHAAVYGLANVLVQASGFILLPLYTRYLTPADYGMLEVLGRLAETTGTLLLAGGMRQALFTFYQQAEGDAERRRVLGATLALLAAVCGTGALLVLALAGPLTGVFNACGSSMREGLLRLALFGALLEPFTVLPLALIQCRVDSARFVFFSLTQFIFRVALCVVFVAGLGWGVAGVLASSAITWGLYGSWLTVTELGRGAAWPGWAEVGGLFRFALPFVPGGLCFFVMHHGDRFVLLRCCGEGEVGTYALGYKMALAVGTFSLMPLSMVWGARMYEVARQPEGPAVFGRAFTRILAAFVLVGLGLCLLEDEAVRVLGGPAYAPAARIIGLVVLACLCQTTAALMDGGFYVRRRTGLKMGITASAAAVMALLYAVLIPIDGSRGAALATLGGFSFYAGLTWYVSQRVYRVRYEWGRVAAMLGLAAGLWAASWLLPVGLGMVPVKLGVWLLWPVLLWRLGVVSAEEKEYALSLAADAWGLLRRPAQRRAAGEAPKDFGPAPLRPRAESVRQTAEAAR
jgi:O-antigen/teichoic acid export membrane protein